jgi:Bifunctional DNA primase/polymerase, N-terminal
MSSAQERGSSHPEPADVNSMPLLEAALAYAAMGLPVFPLHSPVFDADGTFVRCDCKKGARCQDAGKHPWTEHGLLNATTNPDIIRRWWANWPQANIGLRTWTRGGIVVLDADDDVAGLKEAAAYGVDISTHLHTRTGRGAHYPYRVPDSEMLTNKTKKCGSWPLEYCDARGRGGYIVAPPSVHASGRTYVWQQDQHNASFALDALPTIPDKLLEVWAPEEDDPRRTESYGDDEGTDEEADVYETEPPGEDEYVEALTTPAVYFLDSYVRKVAGGADRQPCGFYYALQLRDAGLTKDAATPWMRKYQVRVNEIAPRDHAYDWLEAQASLDQSYSRKPRPSAKKQKGQHDESKIAQALVVLDPIFEQGQNDDAARAIAERFHDEAGETYVTVPVREAREQPPRHHETYKLSSRHVRRWVRYEASLRGVVLRDQDVREVVELWASKAEFEGRVCAVHQRVYQPDDSTIWLDLGDERHLAVRVTPEGWSLVEDPPVKFIRKEGGYALPVPVRDLTKTPQQVLNEVLRPYTNLRQVKAGELDRDWVVFCCFLIASLRPRGPFPILQLTGEKGVAKSTLGRVVRRLIDPHKVELEPQPGDLRDMAIAAQGTWLLAYDNLTELSAAQSNALCRMSTGGGFRTRTLFTDESETMFTFMRPVLLTGLTGVVKRDDLIDRTLTVTLPYLPRTARKTEKTFWEAFAADHAGILAALLDLLSATLAQMPGVSAADLPRMADFAQVSRAIERAMGWKEGTFDKALEETGKEAAQELLEDSMIAGPLLRFIDECRMGVDKKGDQRQEERKLVWQGTLADLLAELLRQLRAIHSVETEPEKRFRDWPKTPQALNARVVELQGALRGRGIEVLRGKRTGASRWWHVYDARDAETATTGYEETHRSPTSMPSDLTLDDEDHDANAHTTR